jgi:ribosome biogenesis GTPase
MRATVISASRRYVDLKLADGDIIPAMAESKAIDIVAGDEVECDNSSGQYIVKKVLDRKNCLLRCYRKAEKKLAANVDLVLIVTAMHPLFNTAFIDRLIAASTAEKIEFAIILNKYDLELNETADLLKIYKDLNIPIIYLSALKGSGFDDLKTLLSRPEIKKAALAGISGVGKTTILNRLIPETESRTANVSERTGQGKQTTSQSYAYTYKRGVTDDLLLIDLPGLSNFGLTHLDRQSVKLYFSEFLKFQSKCQYKDCFHLKEPQCAVKDALKNKEISVSRYQSYMEIINEIDEAKEY